MKNFDIFLEKYKEMENLIAQLENAPTISLVKWYEDNLEDLNMKNKLYICRIIRNYIQHNSDFKDFIIISNGMINFLDTIIKNLKLEFLKISDKMLSVAKTPHIDITTSPTDALKIMSSKNLEKILVLENGKYKGMISILDVAKHVCSNKPFKKVENGNICIIYEDDIISNYLNYDYVFLMKKDKILGITKIDKA